MAQNWPPIPELEFVRLSRPKIEERDETLKSNFSGSAAPSSPTRWQFWADETTGKLKICIQVTPSVVWAEIPFGAALTAFVQTTRQIIAGAGLTGGGTLGADRTLNVAFASEAEAQAGAEAAKVMSPLRVAQALAALAPPLAFAFSFSGLKIDVISNSAVQINAKQLILSTAGGVSKGFNAVNLTVDLASGGLDAGSEAADTWYHVWVFGKADGSLTARFSASATSPTPPSGFTFMARAGAVRNNSSSNLRRSVQYGNRAQYKVDATNDPTAWPLISSGAATPWTAVAANFYVPDTAAALIARCEAIGLSNPNCAIAGNASAEYFGSSRGGIVQARQGTQGPGSIFACGEVLLESASVYVGGAGNNIIQCMGWIDNL